MVGERKVKMAKICKIEVRTWLKESIPCGFKKQAKPGGTVKSRSVRTEGDAGQV